MIHTEAMDVDCSTGDSVGDSVSVHLPPDLVRDLIREGAKHGITGKEMLVRVLEKYLSESSEGVAAKPARKRSKTKRAWRARR